jgi:hypothetical protein
MPAMFATTLRRSSVGKCFGSFQTVSTSSRRNALLSLDFTDILSAFSEEKAEYLVVGGYAIAFHGFLRGTGDFNLFIRISDENASRVWAALTSFGAPLSNLRLDDLKTTGTVFQMGIPPNRIDIINHMDGVDFDEAWPNRSLIELESLTIPVIGKQELLKNKLAMGRTKDLADIAWLKAN